MRSWYVRPETEVDRNCAAKEGSNIGRNGANLQNQEGFSTASFGRLTLNDSVEILSDEDDDDDSAISNLNPYGL